MQHVIQQCLSNVPENSSKSNNSGFSSADCSSARRPSNASTLTLGVKAAVGDAIEFNSAALVDGSGVGRAPGAASAGAGAACSNGKGKFPACGRDVSRPFAPTMPSGTICTGTLDENQRASMMQRMSTLRNARSSDWMAARQTLHTLAKRRYSSNESVK